jgi:hypothetical protein
MGQRRMTAKPAQWLYRFLFWVLCGLALSR